MSARRRYFGWLCFRKEGQDCGGASGERDHFITLTDSRVPKSPCARPSIPAATRRSLVGPVFTPLPGTRLHRPGRQQQQRMRLKSLDGRSALPRAPIVPPFPQALVQVSDGAMHR
jgi:hypothetical protein